MKQKFLFVIFVFIEAILFVSASRSVPTIDRTSTVNYIVDGDTFDISYGWRIRMADIDTPETGEPGYQSAKDALYSLIYGKTVYLDADGTDSYGRHVCLVYVSYNSTHYKNVNKAMLVGGYAEIWDFQNAFDPYTWTLYELKSENNPNPPEYPEYPYPDPYDPYPNPDPVDPTIGIIIAIVIAIPLVFYYKKFRSRKR